MSAYRSQNVFNDFLLLLLLIFYFSYNTNTYTTYITCTTIYYSTNKRASLLILPLFSLLMTVFALLETIFTAEDVLQKTDVLGSILAQNIMSIVEMEANPDILV